MKEILDSLGFFKVEAALNELLTQARDFAEKAGGESTENAFAAYPSFIPRRAPSARHACSLLVDIGGSSSKASVRMTRANGDDEWVFLFERMNSDFQNAGQPGKGVARLFNGLCTSVQVALKEHGITPAQIEGCGVVWSYFVTNIREEPRKISGTFVGEENVFRKRAWFTEDLRNGEDIGSVFLASLADTGLTPESFLISNDAVLTMKALPEADAGVINSTGLNGTLVKRISDLSGVGASGVSIDEQIICNAEMGSHFSIDESLLSTADYLSEDRRAVTIEYLTSGKFLPQLFNSYITALADAGQSHLQEVATYLRNLGENRFSEFGMKDTSFVFMDIPLFLEKRSQPELFSEDVLATLGELSRHLIQRSAMLCSVVCYASIANQLEEKSNFTISLDSRLARKIPLYEEELRRSFARALPPEVSADLVLVERLAAQDGQISVPMIGAANALDSLLDS